MVRGICARDLDFQEWFCFFCFFDFFGAASFHGMEHGLECAHTLVTQNKKEARVLLQ